MPSLPNIQSSSSGVNNIITTEVTTNPLVLHNYNETCKNRSKSVAVTLIKYRQREKHSAARKFWPNDKIWPLLTE